MMAVWSLLSLYYTKRIHDAMLVVDNKKHAAIAANSCVSAPQLQRTVCRESAAVCLGDSNTHNVTTLPGDQLER
jgi:hypothetical protein